MIKLKALIKARKHITARLFSESFLKADSSSYAELMYEEWLKNPNSVHVSWKIYFNNLAKGLPDDKAFQDVSKLNARDLNRMPLNVAENQLVRKVDEMISQFRTDGHLYAQIDPLNLKNGLPNKTLENFFLEKFDKTKFFGVDIEKPIKINSDLKGLNTNIKDVWTPKELEDSLKAIYCGNIGFQYMHIPIKEECDWIRERIEKVPVFRFSKEQKLDLYNRIIESQAFTEYCNKRFSTTKRFGCDGIDSMISGLGKLVESSKNHKISEIVLGMAHRGRLNTLSNVFKMRYNQLFAFFEDLNGRPDLNDIDYYSGDVKYHLGCSNKVMFKDGKEMILNLLPNPSHLEAINPVVLGNVSGSQFEINDDEKNKVLSVVIHGDAAISGQGVVYECQQMENLDAYSVGGTIHIILNNQIGFTADQSQCRSNYYPSNIAKLNNNVVFHVNADDPEAVDFIMELSIDYRMKFKRDVFINLVGYRKFGHNEQDEPKFTQPEMYSNINKTEPMYLKYSKKLVQEGIIDNGETEKRMESLMIKIEQEHNQTKQGIFDSNDWELFNYKDLVSRCKLETFISELDFTNLGEKINTLPKDGFHFHPTVVKTYGDRLKSIKEGINIDWATAESLAFGSLLADSTPIRFTGEDVERGTFSHRHAVLTDQQTNKKFVPLKNIMPKTPNMFQIQNSLLSEYAVLGFEYGYSISNPLYMTIWEAQFGDFSNGAQIILDQFIMGGEKKWGRMSGLVLLLPHGYDGQGPEHSNAQLQRILQSVGDNYIEFSENKEKRKISNEITNVKVVNITNPANYFHALRKQINQTYRKPLFVLSPKKLLRHKMIKSTKNQFLAPNGFQEVLDDESLVDKSKVKRIIVCSGQIYVDLYEKRESLPNKHNFAIIRLEQLGPFPYNSFEKIISTYQKDCQVVFAQEEPLNYGAWSFIQPRINIVLLEQGFKEIQYVGRPVSPVTATGSNKSHQKEIQLYLNQAFS